MRNQTKNELKHGTHISPMQRITKMPLAMLCVYLVASVALYSPSFHRSFASDDYCTLDYLIRQQGLLVTGFFRPVGDFTLKLTYYVFGENAFWFFVLNAALHGVNAWLLYLLAGKIFGTTQKNNVVPALMTSAIFLMYHSVGEVVLWTIGRGISLAVTFSLMAMIAFFSSIRSSLKYVLVCACYFFALACYESVLLLPLILLVAALSQGQAIRCGRWSVLLLLTLFVNLFLRFYWQGKLWTAYAGEVFAKSGLEYLESFVKLVFRILVPAFNRPVLFAALSVVVLGMIAFWLYGQIKRKREDQRDVRDYNLRIAVIALTGLLCTAAVAMFFGASTRTTEGDRLLYFPAVFYALLVATILYSELKGRWRTLAFIILLSVQSFFLFATQESWNAADEKRERLTNQLRTSDSRPVYIINVPSDYKGAFMFRNCFSEALRHHGIDTTGVIAVNRLEYIRSLDNKEPIVLEENDGSLFIWPDTHLQLEGGRVVSITTARQTTVVPRLPLKHFWFWDKERLVGLDLMRHD